ncbi:MAG: bifunctional (p)ppGpp synthetase/guanosine-3',5'-bis(diphosphate) 3'-pyrophosphohydrolase [Gammaproteobacteria bacterium]|nr:bifunctional (p)ppGpp synthetase/guanosine-3',5'-bis(diphosphate) 3'-pyrophosphohydrolase [Rhodocyclaceae bacterium]MBU3908652.1 bifunctional (p)ppGpp synthetase/guanosine-3',5'-bis(diphosphate) 3'-pyrophosphohydrolase [Gammaproteobacteria bacterium]MBU3988102.1 bifunctional (p)ppGpp synthetase/guanosine-3',5'-bis(diphosphate) 3'-pyrophosphohydrolase [Gammaproteobacteria bacterium]MBU4004680.1 bifunctional (p)ppGpp synthetase/guanosine-3',5'-bis(diphosphate) 3'-pyrophosphohydrolase [Gammaprot
MVSVVHSLPDSGIDEASLSHLAAGLADEGVDRLVEAIGYARELYGESKIGTGETAFGHALGTTLILASLNLDIDSRLAALLFAAPDHLKNSRETIAARWGVAVADLVDGLHRLKHLRPLTLATAQSAQGVQAQAEIMRKMLMALAADIRVVLVRLASRTQTLRWYADHDTPERADIARESQQIYAPLANRLGVWQIKWEIEDLSFRFVDPATYKRIAKMLDEKRLERESFITTAIAQLKEELAKSGVTHAEVHGRPKHIYSIWSKMRQKHLEFDQVYDVRALRIILDSVRDCYTALGIVHALWQPIHGEFDDYISHPKGNHYRSLHTAVMDEAGRALEVQIRTQEMHQHAEMGVAAHWRYKESGTSAKADSAYDDKIAWLRQLLSWRDEITDSAVWVEQFKRAALDDTIYVMTPQGRVIDLAKGATPIDFAYRVHTDLGHRCRGAKVDGHLVPLNTPLHSGQQVEITVAKSGGPSRDWLSATQGYLATARARTKVKAWFAAQQEAQMLTEGRAFVLRELQRDGASQANHEDLAHKLGFKHANDLFLAAARGEVGMRAIQVALRGETAPTELEPEIQTHAAKAEPGSSGQILVVGMDKLLTQLGSCCKPVPPDVIAGFVTRGRGVSVHRIECPNFRNMVARNPERVIDAQWGGKHESIYSCDIYVEATDRQGLLRDISDVLSKEKINVTAVKTQSKVGVARMAFTVELGSSAQLQRILTVLGEVPGVSSVQRA